MCCKEGMAFFCEKNVFMVSHKVYEKNYSNLNKKLFFSRKYVTIVPSLIKMGLHRSAALTVVRD